MERGLSAKLEQLYGRELVGMIAVARAQLYTSLAATATYVTPPIARYAHVKISLVQKVKLLYLI